jgi:hypothetical protein
VACPAKIASLLLVALASCHWVLPLDRHTQEQDALLEPPKEGGAIEPDRNAAPSADVSVPPLDGPLPAPDSSQDIDGDGISNDIDPHPGTVDVPLYFGQPGSSSDHEHFDQQWTFGSAICHQNPKELFKYRTRLKSMTASDYLVETRFSPGKLIHDADPGIWPGAGLGARVVSYASLSFSGYTCEVDLQDHRLTIGRYHKNDYVLLVATQKGSAPMKQSYRIRFVVKGSSLACSLPDEGISVTTDDTKHASAAPGLFTFQAAACFDYLLVLKAP